MLGLVSAKASRPEQMPDLSMDQKGGSNATPSQSGRSIDYSAPHALLTLHVLSTSNIWVTHREFYVYAALSEVCG